MAKVSRIQYACIPGLARGDTIEAVAAANKVSRRTIERWLKNKGFTELLKATITKRTDRHLAENDAALGELASASTEALKHAFTKPKDTTWQELYAAQIVQRTLLRVREYRDKHD